MEDIRPLTREEQLEYMIKFYRQYLTEIKEELERLESELKRERRTR